jgi:hypothetical protein
MSIRKIIFCDICNPLAIRLIEFRRASRESENAGQRISDGRAWIEGGMTHAIENGWLCLPDGQHICPMCRKRHLAQSPASQEAMRGP